LDREAGFSKSKIDFKFCGSGGIIDVFDIKLPQNQLDRPIESFRVGGVKISAVDRQRAIEEFYRLVSDHAGGYITATSAHGIVEAQSDRHLTAIIGGAQMTLPDGMPISWIGKLKAAPVERCSGSDFFCNVVRDPRAARLRHYFYGGQEDTTARVVARVSELLGKEAIAGWHCPPIRAAGEPEKISVITNIAARSPDVIWVGLSTPKQEYWMANHTAYFRESLLVGIGAAFDFFAGVRSRAPRIVQHLGFEWLFRLTTEPKRLWPRYKEVVPAMLRIFVIEAVRRLRFEFRI
jgi:N-acetylglucosaminyldiphosphoundecaprenol N-acetyl-beta-D-mannosaminyltransferase